ncbi:MAG TPA: sugar ABC transporter permease [Tetrasphaera sp.]|uniref:sugar ABC transporter permease n=1 Tax=Nostocoides sp. TaxID=1917966 RepID=UPI002C7344C7|nr:sugar ABC transporter permease [Tetrasphaera sp.]HNQ05816.1 sugar ABC transporter permease [Tetrasphaera sp.]
MSTPPTTTDPTMAIPADRQDERFLADEGLAGWVKGSISRLRSGDLGSLPVVIGLILIWGVFFVLNDAFLSSRNLVNLTLQMVPTGTIAIGVVLVLLLGEIDLSVGSVSGLSGAVLAVGFVNHGWTSGMAVGLALLVGVAIGVIYGLLFNRYGVPSFVITLAGLLAVLGLQIKVLGKDGTINLAFTSDIVQFASQKFVPDAVAYALVLLAVGAAFLAKLAQGRRRAAAGLSAVPPSVVLVRTGLLGLILLLAVYILGRDRGVSYMVLTFIALVVLTDLLVRRTRWGRSVMAVGGNVEAARRAGINVKRIYLTVFALSSFFAALGGIFAAARLASVSQSSGGADTNLNAIAAAVIGGTSLFGGRGSAYSALLGILVIQSISNGLGLLSLDTSYRFMVTGGVLLLAVIIDSLSRRSRAAHGRA